MLCWGSIDMMPLANKSVNELNALDTESDTNIAESESDTNIAESEADTNIAKSESKSITKRSADVLYDLINVNVLGILDIETESNVQISLEHTRAEVENYYNGERVNIKVDFSDIDITNNANYSISVPFEAGNTSTWSYFQNFDQSTIDVMVDDIKVGEAVYNANAHTIDVVFTKSVEANETATFTIGTNIAVKETEEDDQQPQQTLDFTVFSDQQSNTVPVVIPTTKKGFDVTVSLSRYTGSNYTGVTVTLNWQALGGLGAGDYFELSFPGYQDVSSFLTIAFTNNSETVKFIEGGTEYGTATLTNGRGTDDIPKIICNFTETNANTNIQGKAAFSGTFSFWMTDNTAVRPTESKIIVNINGILYEFPITISPIGNLNAFNCRIHKNTSTGTTAFTKVGSEIPEQFYKFSWRVTANYEGLPVINPPDGKTMKNPVITDAVEGPGHFIYLDDTYFRIHYIKDISDNLEVLYAPINQWLSGWSSANTLITLSSFKTYLASQNIDLAEVLKTVPYGDGSDPKKVTSFTLDLSPLGDLESFAIQVEYQSYIEDGSNDEIASFKEYFLQSILTSDRHSTIYHNVATVVSEEEETESIQRSVYGSGATASMTSGNLNLGIRKVNENNEPQSYVRFTLYWEGGSQVLSTDANGYVEFTGMGAGLYKLEETTPRAGYAAVTPIFFKVPNTVDTDLIGTYIDLQNSVFSAYSNIDGKVSKISDDVSTTGSKDSYVNVVTNYSAYSLNLTKISSVTGNGLSDATFTLAKYMDADYSLPDTTFGGDGTNVITKTSNTDGTFSFTGLIHGYYILTEIEAPTDYILSSTPIEFCIGKIKTEHVGITANASNQITLVRDMQNVLENSPSIKEPDNLLVVQKLDDYEQMIITSPALFALYDNQEDAEEANDQLKSDGATDVESYAEASTEDGYALFENLPDGTYYLLEKEAPTDYVRCETIFVVSVDGEDVTVDGVTGELIFHEDTLTSGFVKVVNQPITGDMDFVKVAAENNTDTLPGAEFALYKCKDTVGTTPIDEHTHSSLLAGEGGVCCWEEVIQTGNSNISDNDGKFEFTNLTSGIYLLVEMKAPEGYQLSQGQWIITFDASDGIQDISVFRGDGGDVSSALAVLRPSAEEGLDSTYRIQNQKVYELPIAGGKGLIGYILFGISLITFALWILILTRSRQNNNHFIR